MWQWLKETAVEAGVMAGFMAMHVARSFIVGMGLGVLVTVVAGFVVDKETAAQAGSYVYHAGYWFWFLCCSERKLGVVAFLTVAVLAVGGYAMEITLRLQGRRQAADRLNDLIGQIVVERIEEGQ